MGLPRRGHRSISRSMPTSAARSVRFSSQSIRSSAKGPALRIAPQLADPVGPLEVPEHEDVKKLCAGSGAEGVQACRRRSSSSGLIAGGYAVLLPPCVEHQSFSGLGSGPEQVFKRALLADFAGWQSLDVLPAIHR